jgi:hypothetical protein
MPSPTTLAGLVLRIWEAGRKRVELRRESRRLENRVTITLDEFRVHVEAADSGDASFKLHIANPTGAAHLTGLLNEQDGTQERFGRRCSGILIVQLGFRRSTAALR